MKEILSHLFEGKTLGKTEAKSVLMSIASGEYNASQLSAFMSVYLMRSITVDELEGFREAMLELCLPVKFDTNDTIDIVGTGGDGKDTFNISTLSCFVVAGAGVKVTKHGNYGVSSVSGSSNVLEALGYRFTNDVSLLQKQLNEAGLCFLHAPLFHPAMKRMAPIRKELGVRTFFNLLGPVINPSMPKHRLLGVYNSEMARLYNYLLQKLDGEYVIVHSLDGYDEISLTGKFKILSRGSERILDPEQTGFRKLMQEDLYGGSTISDAAHIFMNVLNGKGTQAQNAVVTVNSAFAIQCVDNKISLEQALELAKDSIYSGRAQASYKKLIQIQ